MMHDADAWKRRWPGHCPACRGHGITAAWDEWHGFTSGPAEHLTERCEALDPDQCHRCGAHALDQGCCTACGWTGRCGEGCPPDDPDFPPDYEGE